MVNENIAPPKGVTKISSNTRDNVGKVFNDLNKFIKNSGTYLEDFNDSLDNVTLSMIKFKKEYDKQYKPIQKELNENLNDVVDAFEKSSEKFQDFLKITDENNNDLKNFIFDVRENISNQSVANSNIANKINSGISSFANKITEYMEMPNLDISKLMDNVGTIFDSINPIFENSLSNFINGNFDLMNNLDKNISNIEFPTFDIKDLVINSEKLNDNIVILNSNFDNMKNAIAVNSSRELSRDRRNEIDLRNRDNDRDRNNDRELSRDSKRDDIDPKIREIQERIKSETKKNSIKFLDNKYAKGNEYDKLHNEYQKELEKLKIDALEVFGEGFEQQEEYKKALMELDDEFNKKQHDVGINAIKESFKQESSDNKVKFLDNKYAVGTNYARTQNEYQDEIEKLKTQALETYGEGFEQNKEYQMAMQNLEKKYDEEMHQAKIQDFKEKHEFLGEMYETISNSFKKNEKSLRGIFGPLNLIVAPFEEFFGGSIFKLIGKGMKSFFGIFRKKKPTASDVAKSGGAGVGSLYVGNKIDELIKAQGGEGGGLGDLLGGGGLLKSLFGGGGGGGLMSAIAGKLPMLAGIGMLAAGLLWAVIDGIKGAIQAEDWGVSKFAGFLGGFFGGDAEGGIKNAFKNAGKWALIGAGAGTLICPGIGTIAGGLIGAAVGGVLGAIGGEKLAKGFDKLGTWLKENIWEPIKQFFFNIFDIQKFIDIWKGDGSIVSKIGKTIGQGLITLVKLPFKALIEGGKLVFKIGKSIWDLLGKLWDKLKEWLPKLWEGVKEFFGGLWDGLKNALANVWNGIKEGASKAWNGIKEGASKVWSGTKKVLSKSWNGIKNVSSKAWNGIKKVSSKVWGGTKKVLGKTWDGMKDGLSKTWNKIKDGTAKAWEGIKDGTSKAWDKVKEKTSKAWDGVKDAIGDIKSDFAEGGIKGVVDGIFEKIKSGLDNFFKNNPLGIWINDHIIAPIKNGLGKIGNFFGFINENWDWHHPIESIQNILGANKADIKVNSIAGGGTYTPMQIYDFAKSQGKSYEDALSILQMDVSKASGADRGRFQTFQKEFKKYYSVNDAIIRPNGDIIQTDPKDTIVALKDIPNAMSELKNNVDKQSISMISSIKFDDSLDKKLSDVISLLSKIAEKNLEIQLPQQTRRDMEVIMNGGLI